MTKVLPPSLKPIIQKRDFSRRIFQILPNVGAPAEILRRYTPSGVCAKLRNKLQVIDVR